MPIVIARTGELFPDGVPKITPEQNEMLLGHIVKAWTEKHPERFLEMLEGEDDAICSKFSNVSENL